MSQMNHSLSFTLAGLHSSWLPFTICIPSGYFCLLNTRPFANFAEREILLCTYVYILYWAMWTLALIIFPIADGSNCKRSLYGLRWWQQWWREVHHWAPQEPFLISCTTIKVGQGSTTTTTCCCFSGTWLNSSLERIPLAFSLCLLPFPMQGDYLQGASRRRQ